MNEPIRIALNGTCTEIRDRAANTTLLDWLRRDAGLTGTKEGCAEGDCGACTVVLERVGDDGNVTRSAVNSCLIMLGQTDGFGVRTVEGLTSSDGKLQPIQSALIESGGTQCGFCTPGFVMAAYAFFSERSGQRDLPFIHDALAGNLCRCTGYRPIVAAMQQVAALPPSHNYDAEAALAAALAATSRAASACFDHDGQRFFAPRSFAEALELRARHPDGTILAGGTDLGLLVSQKRQTIPIVIHIGNIPELTEIDDNGGDLAFGAAVTYTDALETLTKYYPTLRTYLTRLGSRQIRNMGTIGGNIGTASPIGDTLPLLLALGGRIRVGSAARGSRNIAVDDFFKGYRETALDPDELIDKILIPEPTADARLFVDKISKRRDQDISTVCAAYRLVLEGGIVREARIAFGGMAPIPKRAQHAERVLQGRRLDLETATAAGAALAQDFQPLSDWRGSAEYRLTVARNLMVRLHWRLAEPSTAAELDEMPERDEMRS